MSHSIFHTIGEGVKKAIPNMIYGNTLFIFSLLVRSFTTNSSITNIHLDGFLSLLAGLSIIFFLGILVAILPAAAGGALLSLWLYKDKKSTITQTGISMGAIIGFIGMAIVCAVIYPIDKPHNLPDPSFPINAGIAILISTLAGARTGKQLALDILKHKNEQH